MMAWDDLIPDDEYDSTIDRMEQAFRKDVTKRATAVGLDVDQFDSLQECDLYLQSIGR